MATRSMWWITAEQLPAVSARPLGDGRWLEDDSSVSTTAAAASPWVPVVAASVGAGAALIVGVLTQWWSTRRENQRWERERGERQKQWQREDSLRWHQDRQQTYSSFLSALFEWDGRLAAARAGRVNDAAVNTTTALDAGGFNLARRAAREQMTSVLLMAPKETRQLATAAVRRREAFWVVYLNDPDIDATRLDKEWARVLDSMSRLLKAMRNDLGLEIAIEDIDSLHGTDEEAPIKVVAPEGEAAQRMPEDS
jgi:hypothetical protein